jgi:hypothetical protein
MRPFSALAMEFLAMAVPTLQGVATGQWKSYVTPEAATKGDILPPFYERGHPGDA